MTEAGELCMDDAIWRDGKVWWVATIGSTGDVTFVDEPYPQDRQVSVMVLERHDEVWTYMDARGAYDEASHRVISARRSLDAGGAAWRAREAMAAIEGFAAAGIVAGFALGTDTEEGSK